MICFDSTRPAKGGPKASGSATDGSQATRPIKLDLIAGNTLFVDGSKLRANASLDHHWSEGRCLRRLEKTDRRIEEILAEGDRTDQKPPDSAYYLSNGCSCMKSGR